MDIETIASIEGKMKVRPPFSPEALKTKNHWTQSSHTVRVHKELRCDWRGGRTRQTQTRHMAFAISIGALTGEGEKCHEFDAEVEP